MTSETTPDTLIGDDEGHISIGIEEKIVNSIEAKLGDSAPRLRSARFCCIHKVPDRFHKMTEHSAYIPEVVSIGPYHRGKESLTRMEDCKLSFMRALLIGKSEEQEKVIGEVESEEVLLEQGEEEEEEMVEGEGDIQEVVTTPDTVRSDSSRLTIEPRGWLTILKDCVASIKMIETEIRNCYSDPIELESEEFVEMMVVDGLFILEYLYRVGHHKPKYRSSDYPLFIKAWLSGSLYWDILLLENQIPIFVLKRLFMLTAEKNEAEEDAFYQIVLGYLRRSFPGSIYIHHGYLERYKDANHLLDLFTRALHPFLINSQDDSVGILTKLKGKVFKSVKALYRSLNWYKRKFIWKLKSLPYICGDYHVARCIVKSKTVFLRENACTSIPGAVELSRAGVQFKKRSSAEHHSFLDIKFCRNGTFEIPPLNIEDGTDRWLRNLVASEQFGYKSFTYMTSYAILMDGLINSAEDVELLRNQGILITHVGSDEQVANMFNKLCNDILKFDSYYSQLYDDVNNFYQKRRHIWKATLKRDYFNNPWAIISFFAALLLILLTVISTVFTTLAWVVPRS